MTKARTMTRHACDLTTFDNASIMSDYAKGSTDAAINGVGQRTVREISLHGVKAITMGRRVDLNTCYAQDVLFEMKNGKTITLAAFIDH